MMEEREYKDHEIDLIDLLFFWLEKWRITLLLMLLFAVAFGGYQYQNALRNRQIKELETGSEPERFYEQTIQDSEDLLKRQEDYINSSAVMRLNPYSVETGILTYYIDGEDNVDALFSSYQSYVEDGRLAKELYLANTEISVEDLGGYLVSFSYHMKNPENQYESQTVKRPENVFTVQIRMPDKDLCALYLEQIEKCMADYADELQAEISEHTLRVLFSEQMEMTDLELEQYQTNVRAKHIANFKNIQTLKAELEAVLKQKNEDVTKESPMLEAPVSFAIKYAAVGMALGVFFSLFVFFLYYLMGGRLQNAKNFSAEYTIPALGLVYVPKTKKKAFGFIDRWLDRLRTGVYAEISREEQIRIAAMNVQNALSAALGEGKPIERVMLAGTIPEKDAAELCEQLLSELQGISVSSYRQIAFQSVVIRELEEYDAVIFVEKRGVSCAERIMRERKLALSRNVTILGAVLLF